MTFKDLHQKPALDFFLGNRLRVNKKNINLTKEEFSTLTESLLKEYSENKFLIELADYANSENHLILVKSNDYESFLQKMEKEDLLTSRSLTRSNSLKELMR